MNTSMPKFIGITELRNKTREIFDFINEQSLPVVVVRESKPEAVIVSYKEYNLLEQQKRNLWNKRLDELAIRTKPYIERYLIKKGFKPDKVNGDKLVEILEEDDKSSR